MVTVIKDVNLFDEIKKYDLIIVTTNTYGSMRNGFEHDVELNYPYVKDANLLTKYGDVSKMGTIIECAQENEPTFILSFICKGYPFRKKGETPDFLSYESLEKCLKLINVKYKGKTIAAPMIGCSRFDGNGDKERVMEIINNTLTDVNIIIYDYFQETREEKKMRIYKEEMAVKEKDYQAYYEMVKKRKAEEEERFRKNGHARY